MNRIVKAVPVVLAILCALALLPWLIGVPGVENDFARGWTIGLYALLSYLGLFIAVSILRLFIYLGWLRLRADWLDSLLLAAVAGFVVAQSVAWTFILR